MFVVGAQIEDQDLAARAHHAGGLGERARGIGGVMQRLREQGDIHRRGFERQPVDLAALERDVVGVPPAGQRLGAREHRRRAIDGNHPARPARDFDGQIALAAADVDDIERREQMAERTRPGRPAAARHELPAVARVGAGVLIEVFAPHAAALPAAAPRRP